MGQLSVPPGPQLDPSRALLALVGPIRPYGALNSLNALEVIDFRGFLDFLYVARSTWDLALSD